MLNVLWEQGVAFALGSLFSSSGTPRWKLDAVQAMDGAISGKTYVTAKELIMTQSASF